MEINQYYHVYNRGADKRPVFLEPQDYSRFIRLFDRYLSLLPTPNTHGGFYPNFSSKVKLVSYCLMPNHFHLLIGVSDQEALGNFMQCLKIAYSRAFNIIRMRTGVLFETRYHARPIESNYDIMNVSRYIHRNATVLTKDLHAYLYSSIRNYEGGNPYDWLDSAPVMDNFKDASDYRRFIDDVA